MELGLLILIGIATILVAFGVDKAIRTEKRLEIEKQKRKQAERAINNLKDIVLFADKYKENGMITVSKIRKELFSDDNQEKIVQK